MIDPVNRALKLRETLKKDDKILVVDFSDTLQGKDTSKVIDLMPNTSTGEHVFRTKVNIKELDPIAAGTYGVNFFDTRQKTDNEIEDFVKRREFDFPLWYKHSEGFAMSKVADYNYPFILQVAGCNFHDGTERGGCWYCFVDDKSNDGKPTKGKTFLGVEDTVDSMLNAQSKIRQAYAQHNFDVNMRTLRVSGGEPTVVLDWVLSLWREVEKRGLDLVGQLDSNLSTGRLVDSFEKQGIYEEKTLEKLAQYPIKVLTALKGVDTNNLQENVQSTATLEEQKYSLRKFITAGFDIYPQMYNPNPNTLEAYLEEMDGFAENISLRIHIGPLKLYGPNTKRLQLEAKRLKMEPEQFIKQKQQAWDSNYANGCAVMDSYLRKRYGVGYREVTRSDVALKLKE